MRRFFSSILPMLCGIALAAGCGADRPVRARSPIAPASQGAASAEPWIASAEKPPATPQEPRESAGAESGGGCVPAEARRERAAVVYVTDGDTIGVEAGGVPFRVRYIGIDAPELDSGGPGKEAAAANRALVEGKTVEMVRDLSEADRYGRLLRFVFADGVFVNRELVRSGRAWAGYYPPDLSCTEEFQAAEEAARRERLGLWGLLGSPTFQTRTGAGCAGGCVTPPPGCRIKGNINAEGEKIYHVPGGKYYEQTVIDPEKGERWFCSEAEALAAGWRKSKV